MSSDIRIRRGEEADIPILRLAELGFTTDTKRVLIGDGIGNTAVGGVGEFISLSDTPTTYSGAAGKGVIINQSEDGVEFATLSGINNTAVMPLSVVQVRRNSNYHLITSWTSIYFDVVDISSDESVLEFDSINKNKIFIKKDGVYEVSIHTLINTTGSTKNVYFKVVVNGIDTIQGSDFLVELYPNEIHEVSRDIVCSLVSGDFLTLQMHKGHGFGESIIEPGALMSVKKLDGVQGPKGETGYPGEVTVSGSAYFDSYDSCGGLVLSSSWQDIPFDVIRTNSANFIVNNNIELIIPQTATYNINSRVTTNIVSGSSRSDCKIRLMRNSGYGYQEVPGTLAYIYNRTRTCGVGSTSINTLLKLNSGDKVKVQVVKEVGTSVISTLSNGSSFSIFMPGGLKGDDGVPGSGSSMIIKKDGVNLINTPHSSLNFIGSDWNIQDGGSGIINIGVNCASVFGSWYAWDGEDNQTVTIINNRFQSEPNLRSSSRLCVTTSNNFQNKVSLNVLDIPSAYYRLGWYFEWKINSTSRDFMARIQVDDINTVMEMNEESKDSTSWHTQGGFAILQIIAGNHHFDLDFKSETNGVASYMRRARLELWMIAQ